MLESSDAELIAAAVNALPRLIAEVCRLKQYEAVIMDPVGCMERTMAKKLNATDGECGGGE